MSHKKAVLLTCMAALIWSLAGINIKMIDWSPCAIAGGRSLFATIFLLPAILKSKNLKLNRYVLGGALCYAAFNYCFIISTKLTTSANAIMLQYTAPVYVAILSWIFLKERITRKDIISIVFVSAGMFLFFIDKAGGGTLVGNLIALLNGVTFAGIVIFLRFQKNGNPVISMFIGNLLTGFIGIPFILSVGALDKISFSFLVISGGMAALSYFIYAKATTKLSALESVLIPIIDPIMNPVWVFFCLGEKPGTISLLGAGIVLIAVTSRVASH